jgi:hypothetical protein
MDSREVSGARRAALVDTGMVTAKVPRMRRQVMVTWLPFYEIVSSCDIIKELGKGNVPQ